MATTTGKNVRRSNGVRAFSIDRGVSDSSRCHIELGTQGFRVFGIAAVLLGIIGLIWGDFAAVWQPIPADFAYRTPLAYAMAALLLIGGSLVLIKRNVHGIAILIALYFVSALMWLPQVVASPEKIGGWAGFAELFSLTTAGVALYASTQPAPSQSSSACNRSSQRDCFRDAFGGVGCCGFVSNVTEWLIVL